MWLVPKTICLFLGLAALGCAATTTGQHKVAKHPATKHPAVKHPGAKHPAVSHPEASHPAPSHPTPRGKTTKSAGAKAKRGKRATRSYQQAPTPERYKEIQQALAGKGYFQGEPNGTWGPDSVDALKRFQAEQNLTPDGKIGSLSLIALGLGPKRLSAQASPAPAPDTPK